LASKKGRSPYVEELRDRDNISTENHMQVFARLASVKNMHGTPGDPHKKRKSK
jgi:hypothetical protein